MPRSTLFEAPNITDIRYVWDPLVHEWHGERCTFLLLRLGRIDASTLATVEEMAEGIGLVATSVYLIYGYYDLLIRTWATPAEIAELASQLDQRLDGVETESFSVGDIDYSRWSGRRAEATPKAIVVCQKAIQELVEGCSGDQTLKILDRLEPAGLVHRYCPNQEHRGELYKVYLVLRRQRVDDPELSAARMNRLESVVGTLDFLEMPTVYYGSGRTIDCIIKGIVSGSQIGVLYSHVLALKQRLEAADLVLRPMTMILAKAGETDRDHLRIDIDSPDSRSVRYLKAHLTDDTVDRWRKIDRALQAAVVEAFENHWTDVAETPFAKYFLDLIEGGLAEDTYKINGSLTFLFMLEDEVRKAAVFGLLPTELGSHEWRQRVIDFLSGEEVRLQAIEAGGGKNGGEARKERLRVSRLTETVRERTNNIGLGECLHLMRRLVEGGVVHSVAADRALGAGWFERYLPASELRNDFTHGRLVASTAPDAEQWRQLADRVLSAGKLLGRLNLEDQ